MDSSTKKFRNRNGALWDKRHIHKILNHPVYLGEIRLNGYVFPGIHQPLVSKTVFNKAQHIFAERKVNRESKTVLGLLKGVLFCAECEHPMTPNNTKKKNGKIYRYYRCISTLNPKDHPCINKYFNIEKANDLVSFNINVQSLGTNALKKWLECVENITLSKDESVVVMFKGIAVSV